MPEVKRIMQQYNVQTNQIWFEIGQAFRGRYCYLESGSFHLKVRAVSAHDTTSKGKWTACWIRWRKNRKERCDRCKRGRFGRGYAQRMGAASGG